MDPLVKKNEFRFIGGKKDISGKLQYVFSKIEIRFSTYSFADNTRCLKVNVFTDNAISKILFILLSLVIV